MRYLKNFNEGIWDYEKMKTTKEFVSPRGLTDNEIKDFKNKYPVGSEFKSLEDGKIKTIKRYTGEEGVIVNSSDWPNKDWQWTIGTFIDGMNIHNPGRKFEPIK